MYTKTTNKKSFLLLTLAFILTITSVFGTIAWLSTTDSVTNTFTVGNIEKPNKPDGPFDPENPVETDEKLTGNIYEPSWNPAEDHKLVPGASFAKDPYVGIGKGSEDSYVFAWVTGNDTLHLEYAINVPNGTDSGWVEITTTPGLYVWSDDAGAPVALEGKADQSVWTTQPLFSEVSVPGDATEVVAGGLTVNCFIHQATSGDGSDLYTTALTAAAAEKSK